MFLKELESWLERGQIVPFLREKRPLKKMYPQYWRRYRRHNRNPVNLIRKHVPLKELESWLKRGQNVQFLREICPRKKCIPKSGANIGAITGILLSNSLT
jgi:intein/homing endonuclease